ncbi:hypothetical protein M513_07416 [Trichuris suis]|uniref:Uncharacterized protein n=1 Tax=Trichuris suis TaxID=68888 RepID=A0A085M3C4_9BILA|nr:hypothetical protein M513_07416 [Trichuris suis]
MGKISHSKSGSLIVVSDHWPHRNDRLDDRTMEWEPHFAFKSVDSLCRHFVHSDESIWWLVAMRQRTSRVDNVVLLIKLVVCPAATCSLWTTTTTTTICARPRPGGTYPEACEDSSHFQLTDDSFALLEISQLNDVAYFYNVDNCAAQRTDSDLYACFYHCLRLP